MKPNIVYIYADDLGRGMLSCYGQRHFATPNIDRLAREGMRFTSAYGTAFCAPARASLMMGIHDAHAGRWTFRRGQIYHRVTSGELPLAEAFEIVNNTGMRPRQGDLFLAGVARRAGYATGQIGKLEWGFSTGPEEIRAHGWDYHYGYYDHHQCHGFYPPYVFEDGRKIDIPGNTREDFGRGHYGPFPDGTGPHDPTGRAVHSQDLFDREIERWIRAHRDRPFFLYHPSQLPHGPIYFPDTDPAVADVAALTPIEKEFASMVLRLDRTVGMVLDLLDELKLTERTLVLFASDNGHIIGYAQPGRSHSRLELSGTEVDDLTRAFRTETCGDVFNGNDGMAGLKATNWEGGARIPFLARWPGTVPAGKVSSHLLANYDTLATVAELIGAPLAEGLTDGISYLPVLRGEANPRQHDHVVYSSWLGPSLVTRDGWKVRTFLRRDRIVDFSTFGAQFSELAERVTWQLYHLPSDPAEKRDRSAEEPAKLRELQAKLLAECDGNLVHGTPEAHFAFSREM
jgi:arylsulfatase A-like enzyme